MSLDSYFDYDLVGIAEALALNPGKRFLPTYIASTPTVSFHCMVIYHDNSARRLTN